MADSGAVRVSAASLRDFRNYARAEIVCRVSIDFSNPDAPDTEGDYRAARLLFSGVSAVAIDPPAGDDLQLKASMIDADTETAPSPGLDAPPDGFLCCIFVAGQNGFIRIAARDVRLDWV